MSARTEPQRHTQKVVSLASASYARALDEGLMQVGIEARDGKRVRLEGGREVVEFASCSYLGLDTRPDVVAGAQRAVAEWGVHLCTARSRFTIGPIVELEAKLSSLWGGRAITFPSVTTMHMSVMPLLTSSAFGADARRTAFLFDRFAHASMQYLRPVLAVEHHVEVLPHNDLAALEARALAAKARGEHVVYVADGVYSMGGLCPLEQLLPLAERLGLFLYLDDAHGTSIFGAKGEGSVLARLGTLPENVAVAFSLSKGFGCNGGGVLVPTVAAEKHVRTFGQTYAFSGPLDFAVAGAALVAEGLHRDGTVATLQTVLREKVARFDAALGIDEPFSPIRMVKLGDDARAIDAASALLERGYYVSVTFFPIVPRGEAQLRICLTAEHADRDIDGLVRALNDVGALE